jgi:hypothetical protein
MSYSIKTIGAEIKGLQQQTTHIDNLVSKNLVTLLGMTTVKAKPSPIGMHTISKEEFPSSFEETYNELLDHKDLL